MEIYKPGTKYYPLHEPAGFLHYYVCDVVEKRLCTFAEVKKDRQTDRLRDLN